MSEANPVSNQVAVGEGTNTRRDELRALPCTCVICSGCRGSGDMWMDISGRYSGPGPCDDMDQPETCMWCEGSGVTEMCDRCAELNDIDEQESLTGQP